MFLAPQFAKLIGQMDRDGDGEVTYKEFLDYFTRDFDATTVTSPGHPNPSICHCFGVYFIHDIDIGRSRC